MIDAWLPGVLYGSFVCVCVCVCVCSCLSVFMHVCGDNGNVDCPNPHFLHLTFYFYSPSYLVSNFFAVFLASLQFL